MTHPLETYYIDERENLLRRIGFGAGTPENAEDILQEAFARALQYWKTYDASNKELGAWFSRILTNALRNFKTDEKKYGMCEEFDEELYDPQEMIVKDREVIKKIYELIDSKQEHHQEILTLYYKHHYTVTDISRITDQKVKTVKQVVWRFKQEVLKEYAN